MCSPTNVANPWNANANDNNYNATTGGNPTLESEAADTTTFGTVLSFDKFRFSVDWFEIDLGDAITLSPGNQPLIDACFRSGGTSIACDRVTGYGTADITAIDSSAVNLAGFLTRGWDYEASYDVPLSSGANINLRFIGTYLYDMIVDTGLGVPPIDYEGQSGPVGSFGSFNTQPKWQARAVLDLRDDSDSRPRSRRATSGSGTLNTTVYREPSGRGQQHAAEFGHRQLGRRCVLPELVGIVRHPPRVGRQPFQLFWSVNNLLDEDPAVAPGGNAYPTNPVFFDTIGRRARIGVRFTF